MSTTNNTNNFVLSVSSSDARYAPISLILQGTASNLTPTNDYVMNGLTVTTGITASNINVTGIISSINATSITGSLSGMLYGTATSASVALSSSYLEPNNDYVVNQLTASTILASLEIGSSSFAINAGTASYLPNTPINAVNDFGCDNTGNTDSTLALQKAINAASAASKALYIPAGTYSISNTLNLNGFSHQIFGDGDWRTILQATSAMSAMIAVNPNNTGQNHVIENLQINANNLAAVGLQLGNVNGTYSTQGTIQNVGIEGGLTSGMDCYSLEESYIVRCRFQNNNYGARLLYVSGAFTETDTHFTNCNFHGNTWGMFVQNTEGLVVKECTLESQSQCAILLNGLGTGQTPFRVTLDHNWFEENVVNSSTMSVVHFVGTGSAPFENVIIRDNYFTQDNYNTCSYLHLDIGSYVLDDNIFQYGTNGAITTATNSVLIRGKDNFNFLSEHSDAGPNTYFNTYGGLPNLAPSINVFWDHYGQQSSIDNLSNPLNHSHWVNGGNGSLIEVYHDAGLSSGSTATVTLLTTASWADNSLTSSFFGGGTNNYLPKWSTSNTLTATSLVYDNGTNVGVGMTNPSYLLDVSGSGRFLNDILIGAATFGLGGGSVTTNTAIGFLTLTTNNSSGTHNVGVGYAALKSNTSGGSNIGIGYEALFTSTGTGNIAIGDSAGYGNAGGSSNIYIGTNTGTQVTLQSYNVFVGGGIGGSVNISGSGNTIVGANAFVNAISASNNIIFGFQAGSSSSGSNNVIIGSQVQNQVLGGSNQINIANAFFGSGSSSTTGQNVNNTYNFGLGVGTPANKLDVKGNISCSVITASLFGTANTASYYVNYRAGAQAIASNVTNQIVLFTSPLASANYSVAITPDSNPALATTYASTGQTIYGFTCSLNAGISGGLTASYTAFLYN